MNNVMMGQSLNMIPMVVTGGIIHSVFAGFVTIRVPTVDAPPSGADQATLGWDRALARASKVKSGEHIYAEPASVQPLATIA